MIDIFIDLSVWFKVGPTDASSKVKDNLYVSAYQNKIK